MEPETTQRRHDSEKVVYIIIVITFALFVAISTVWLGHATLETAKLESKLASDELEQKNTKIEGLKNRIVELERELGMTRTPSNGTVPTEVPPSQPSAQLTGNKSLELFILSSVKLCMGEQYIIRWKATGFSPTDTVWLFALRPGGSSANIDVRPIYANQNESGRLGEGLYVWEAGKWAIGSPNNEGFLQEGIYRIHIFDPNNQAVEDKSDPIQLVDCLG